MEVTNTKKSSSKRKASLDLSTMVYGKVPPQAKELEEVVLGAIMLERNAFNIVSDFLVPEAFYVDAHQRIFKAFQYLASKGHPIDILTTVERLKATEELDIIGGPYYLTEINRAVKSSANIEYHSRIIFQKFIQREVIRISADALNQAYEDSIEVSELLDHVQTEFFKVTKGLYKKDFTDMQLSAMRALDEIETGMNKVEGEIMGVPSGFKEIDICTGGFKATDLIILAARPAVGKTALALNIAVNAATHLTQAVGVALFSLEMSESQLVQRMLSSLSEVPLEKIRDRDLNEIEQKLIWAAADKLGEFPIYIDDSANLNIIELKSKVKRLIERTDKTAKQRKLKKGIGLIIIDYLQLMNGVNDGTHKNKNEIVSEISRELKILAKEVEVPIIALSQMARGIETRTDKTPQLSDLRDSGAIEQDGDLIMFIWKDGIETKVRIAKHRNGKLKTLNLRSRLEIQKFYDNGAEPSSPRKFAKETTFDETVPPAEDEFSFINNK